METKRMRHIGGWFPFASKQIPHTAHLVHALVYDMYLSCWHAVNFCFLPVPSGEAKYFNPCRALGIKASRSLWQRVVLCHVPGLMQLWGA